jgi:hypothetical protein
MIGHIEVLVDNTELTDTAYLALPIGISTLNLCVSNPAFTTKLSDTLVLD